MHDTVFLVDRNNAGLFDGFYGLVKDGAVSYGENAAVYGCAAQKTYQTNDGFYLNPTQIKNAHCNEKRKKTTAKIDYLQGYYGGIGICPVVHQSICETYRCNETKCKSYIDIVMLFPAVYIYYGKS